jgi:hypothetical protein
VLSKPKICLIVFTLLSSFLNAQDRCGFDIIHQKKLKEDPGFRKIIEDQDKWISNYILQQGNIQRDQVAAIQYTIPVVVHIVHTGGAIGSIYNPTDADIQNTIAYLNQVYNGTYPGTEGVGDIEIQFALAQRDPSCNPTNGINRVNGSGLTEYTTSGVRLSGATGAADIDVKNLSRWDPSRYYNIWLVNKIDSKDGTSGSFVAGYAYFPNSPVNLDGTIMLATQMQPARKTLPHEIGHAFSLYHPFQGASGATCPTNSDCSLEGDRVCDTDPVIQPSGFVCSTGTNSCTSTPFSINTEHNYMNYTSCATLFTAGQKARLLAGAASSGRIGLTRSYALSPLYPLEPYIAPMAASCSPSTPASGLIDHYAGIMGVTLASRTSTSGTARTDGGYLNNTSDCHKLIQLQRGTTYTIDVTLLGENAEQLKGWIDFNNNGIFDNATEQVISFSENTDPATSRGNITASAAFSVPSNGVLNTALRLRLIEDVSEIYGTAAISNACSNPEYGQAEDYAVYLLPSGTLPLTLGDFSGLPDGRNVLLSWETNTEINTGYFIIQRSADNISFEDIGNQNARGQAGRLTRYSFRDQQATDGKWYYRLKMVDLDERYEFSKTISVTIKPNAPGDSRLMENPVSTFIDVQLRKYSTKTSLLVFDISGRKVMESTVPAGISRYRINETTSLRAGIYLLEIRSGNDRELIRFMKK